MRKHKALPYFILYGLYWTSFFIAFLMGSVYWFYFCIALLNALTGALIIWGRKKCIISKEFLLLFGCSSIALFPAILLTKSFSIYFLIKLLVVLSGFFCMDNLYPYVSKYKSFKTFVAGSLILSFFLSVFFMEDKDFDVTIRFGNTGLFSIFFSILILIYMIERSIELKKMELLFLLLISGFVFYLFPSRVAILILCIGFILLIGKNMAISKRVKVIISVSTISLLLGFSFSDNKKIGSTNGRKLIYKVILQNIHSVPNSGYGLNSFPHVYPLLQEKYYREGYMTKEEIQLADDTRYAFNEFFQVFYELGIWGFLSVVLWVVFIIKWKQMSFFFSILPSLLFSYPFHNDYVLYLLLCLWIVYAHSEKRKYAI